MDLTAGSTCGISRCVHGSLERGGLGQAHGSGAPLWARSWQRGLRSACQQQRTPVWLPTFCRAARCACPVCLPSVLPAVGRILCSWLHSPPIGPCANQFQQQKRARDWSMCSHAGQHAAYAGSFSGLSFFYFPPKNKTILPCKGNIGMIVFEFFVFLGGGF